MISNKPVMWGALGGILPNIVQKAQQLMSSSPEDSLDAIIYPTFVVGLILLAIIGGVIVASFREQDSRKALFLGISAPALITVAASAPQQNFNKLPSAAKPASAIVGSLLISSAYADDSSDTPEKALEKKVNQAILQAKVTPDIDLIPLRFIEVFSVHDSDLFSISFLNAHNEEVQSLDLPEKRYGKIAVPPDAAAVRFVSAANQSAIFALPENNQELKGYFVEVTGQRIYDFWSAFGRAPEIKYQFNVTEQTLNGYESGKEGWSYAGQYEQGKWLGKFFNFPENKLPELRATYQVDYPVNVRKESNKDADILGQLRLGQEVEVLEYTSSDQVNYWIRMKVLR